MKFGVPHILEFPQNGNSELGYLSFIEDNQLIPFDIKRVYWIYGLERNSSERGNHAHINDEQVIICMQGKAIIETIDQNNNTNKFELLKPSQGLFVPKLIWKNIKIDSNTILICISSKKYQPNNYLKDFNTFLNHK